jgi:hypothetical protein
MSTDDTLARLKVLSERLDRIRKQAQEIHNVASAEVKTACTNSPQREMPNTTERRAVRRF